jgi:hypothetical protein
MSFTDSQLLYCLALMLTEKINIPIQILLLEFTNFTESVAYVSKQLNLSIQDTIFDCEEICRELTNGEL